MNTTQMMANRPTRDSGPDNTPNRPLIDRVAVLEARVAQIENDIPGAFDSFTNDLRAIADTLGVILPSDRPKEAR